MSRKAILELKQNMKKRSENKIKWNQEIILLKDLEYGNSKPIEEILTRKSFKLGSIDNIYDNDGICLIFLNLI